MDMYPLTYDVTPPEGPRNRLTSAFRLILSIPHILLVGSPASVGIGANSGNGVLGAVAGVIALIAWFAILFTGRYPRSLFDFVVGTGRWGLRVCAYAVLLVTDVYPPFSLK